MKLIENNLQKNLSEIIEQYEKQSKKPLQPAQVERLLLNVFAYREGLLREQINYAFSQTLPQFAVGQSLDLLGEFFGVRRIKNQKARCFVRFSKKDQAPDFIRIDKGTRIKMGEHLQFETLNDVFLTQDRQYIDVICECTQSGEVGNHWALNSVKSIVNEDLNAILIAQNIEIPLGGVDIESDDSLRGRVLSAPEKYTTAGSIGAYTYHARSVSPYISDVRVINPKGQGGQVQVIILTETGVPSSSLLVEVEKVLSADRVRPLCDQVTVTAPEVVQFSIQAHLSIYAKNNKDEVLNRARRALNTYIQGLERRIGIDIVPLNLQKALMVDGVYNVEIQSPALTKISETQCVQCTGVQLSVQEVNENE